MFSRREHVWDGLDPARVMLIPPSIDAFSAKNQELARGGVRDPRRARLQPGEPRSRPGSSAATAAPAGSTGAPRGQARRRCRPGPGAVIQVSRWDRLKDPEGVLEAFARHIAPRSDAHLVLAGPSTAAVADDPEGAEVLSEVGRRVRALPAGTRERVHLFSLPMGDVDENAAIVNALQRRADVVVQKSIAEGFGLTVAEAMWKARPVVAGRVGGIREQVVDGETGLLVDPLDLEGFGDAVAALLEDRERAEAMGARAREAVREHFLGPRHLRQYVDLFERLLLPAPAAP